MCSSDAGVLNVRGANSGVTNLQAAHRSGLQLSGTHGVERELCAGDAAAGELAGGHHAAFQRIGHRAQRDRGVPACQAVVGILRHAHGHFHTDAPGDDAHAVAKENVGKRCILAVFLGIRAVHEIHLEGDGRQVTALVVLSLCCLPHEREAFLSASGFIAVRDLFGLGHRQVNPLRMHISADIRTVDIELRKVQDVAVRVLSGGHDARDHIRLVHVVGDAGQVLAFPDLHIGIVAHALNKKHVKPVPCQFCCILLDQTAFAEHGFHGVFVLPRHVFRGGSEVGIKGKTMGRQAGCRKALYDRSPHRIGRGLQRFDHIVKQVVEHMACVDRHLIQLRHDAINAKRLVAQLPGLNGLVMESDVGLV